MTHYPQSTVDEKLEQARRNAAGTAENAAHAQEIVSAHPDEATGAALVWAGIVACVILGAPLVFVCVPRWLAGVTWWAPWGTLFGAALLVLAWAAVDAMGRRGGGR